jgi:hypothetical protein
MELVLSKVGRFVLEEPGSGYKEMFVLYQHLEAQESLRQNTH